MKIRIGNDIHLKWTILKDKQPYILNENAKIRLLDTYNKPVQIECTIKENIVDLYYRGKDQHTYGKYTLLLVENEDEIDMVTVDFQNAFEITKHTTNNYPQLNTDVIIEIPNLTTNMESVYELPTASETILGGVRPFNKTPEMSQVVGVDPDGRLYTKDNKYDDTALKSSIEANTTLLGQHTIAIEKNTTDVANNVKKLGEIDATLLLKADKTELTNLATKSEVENKQDTLISGTNIKTINNESILGEGNIKIEGGGVYDDTQIKKDIKKNADDILLKADKSELTPLATKLEVEAAKYDDTQIRNDIKKNTDDILLKADKTELTPLATKSEVEAAKYDDTQVKADIALKADKTELTPLATKSEVEAAKYDDTQIRNDISQQQGSIDMLKEDVSNLQGEIQGADATITNINNIIG